MIRPVSLLALLALAAPSVKAQDFDPNKTVATVNGEEIKFGDYVRRMEWFRADPNSAMRSAPIGFQVLRQMVSERIIVQLAKSKGVLPTGPEVDARVAELYAEEPNLKNDLKASGQPETDLRFDLLQQEAQFKLMTAGITVTDQEIEKHYKDYPSEFTIPKKVKLRLIAVNDDAAQKKVDDALKAGRPFADVAKELSEDPSKTLGGEYGEIPITSLSENSRKLVESTPVGSSTAWITGGTTRAKFYVEAISPEKLTPLDANLKRSLRRRLMLDRGRAKNNVEKDLRAATLSAKVTFAQPQFQALYNQLIDKLRKEQG